MENYQTEAAAIAEIARQADGRPFILQTEAGRELLIGPDEGGGFRHVDVSEPGIQLAPEPAWIAQGLILQTEASLIDYVDRFKRPETVLFADIAVSAIVAAIDFHAGTQQDGGEKAGRVDHKASLQLPFSVEWKRWTEIDGELMGQLEFARFLEENAADIEAPDAGDVLEACRDLQAKRKVNFTKAVRTASDNETFEYTDETSAQTKGGVEIPTRFLLRIPVYFGGGTHELGAFLRWRLDEDKGLLLGIRLHNPEHVRQAVFKGIVDQVSRLTERAAYFGKL